MIHKFACHPWKEPRSFLSCVNFSIVCPVSICAMLKLAPDSICFRLALFFFFFFF